MFIHILEYNIYVYLDIYICVEETQPKDLFKFINI